LQISRKEPAWAGWRKEHGDKPGPAGKSSLVPLGLVGINKHLKPGARTVSKQLTEKTGNGYHEDALLEDGGKIAGSAPRSCHTTIEGVLFKTHFGQECDGMNTFAGGG
jgi:hypothetical protein